MPPATCYCVVGTPTTNTTPTSHEQNNKQHELDTTPCILTYL